MRSPDDIVWGLGLGCNGEVRVLLERISPEAPPAYLEFLSACDRTRAAGVLVTVFHVEGAPPVRVGDRIRFEQAEDTSDVTGEPLHRKIEADAAGALARGRSTVGSYETGNGRFDALVEYIAPAISLVIFGAGGDALPLVRFASELGWQVTVADNRPAYAREDRFPEADAVKLVEFDRLERAAPRIDANTAVVVMTHHFLHDLNLMRFLLSSAARYLGVLGPKQRTQNLLEELRSTGFEPTLDQLGRLHGPVGIDIGSESPEEIALSALAEIRAVLAGRKGGFLRDRRGPLHDEP
jgi:xanthine/CO dehydrogenase XdhC/CoxF family maturation factor